MSNVVAITFLLVASLVIFCQSADSKINYHVWFNPDPNSGENGGTQTKILTTKPYEKFIAVMDSAAAEDATYKYHYIQYSFGKYIDAINGVYEDKPKKIHWMIYNMTTAPNPTAVPDDKFLSPLGVDLLEVEDGKHYLFWRKRVEY